MRSNRITDNLNLHRSNVNPQRIQQYQQLEEAYANKNTIQFAPEHTCDSKRTALRAAVVCILTILRKYTFNNAVLLT
uniref:Uncharacterized protein n=1 Tax=Panagrolaimus sp. PS1159 TaxID=55785 RepID=A0AC35GTP2_9BILA